MIKRRHHSKETKLRIIKEAIATGNVSIVARRYDLSASMVSKWVRQYKKDNDKAFDDETKNQVATPALLERVFFCNHFFPVWGCGRFLGEIMLPIPTVSDSEQDSVHQGIS